MVSPEVNIDTNCLDCVCLCVRVCACVCTASTVHACFPKFPSVIPERETLLSIVVSEWMYPPSHVSGSHGEAGLVSGI